MSFRNPLNRKLAAPAAAKSPPHVPTSTELSTLIEQFLHDKSTNASPRPSSPSGISKVQEYIVTAQPTWSVPEKRRLRKFLKRATSLTPQRNSRTSPSTPSSPVDNDELDNRSERSRASRLKGITNRLFGGGSKRNVPSEVSATIPGDDAPTLSVDEVLTDAVACDAAIITTTALPSVNDPTRRIQQPGEDTSTLASTYDDDVAQSTVDTSFLRGTPAADHIYAEDQDSISTKKHRCCFLFC